MLRRSFLLMPCALAALLAAGCSGNSAGGPELAALGAPFVLSEEPADALGVLDAREAVGTESEIVLVGQIPASPDPWTKGKALFLVADPAALATEEDPAHACGDGCPFCAKKQEDQTTGLAVVQFVDSSGQVLQHDARQLFGVESNQMVVVRGKAVIDELGTLIVSANGLYIRR